MKLRARKENMEKVIAALESGEYQQARGTLLNRNTGSMCATGVALEVARLDGVPWSWGLGGTAHTIEELEDAREGYSAFNQWLWEDYDFGRTLTIPLKSHPDDETLPDTVIYANDRGESFWQIAQRLRETYLKDEG